MQPPKGTLSFQDAAKVLFTAGFSTGPKMIFDQLKAARVLMSDSMPFQEYLTRGWFRVIRGHWEHPTQGRIPYCRCFVTDKGLEAIKTRIPVKVSTRQYLATPKLPGPSGFFTRIEMSWAPCVMGF